MLLKEQSKNQPGGPGRIFGTTNSDQLECKDPRELVRKANHSLAAFDLISGDAVQVTSQRLKLMTKRTRQQLP